MCYDTESADQTETILQTKNLSVYYGNFLALREINISIPKKPITAFVGPLGCGKSTLLRCFNRLNDLTRSFRAEGKVYYYEQDLYAPKVNPVKVRRQIGMVFQKPNPLPRSIYDNISFGARINGFRGNMDELVERSLRQTDLWDEVKDKLQQSCRSLSAGQQQRLCIARVIALQPEVILMDEPTSALDPISTLRIEGLLQELKEHYTIVIVTQSLHQAARTSDMTAFFNVQLTERGQVGHLVEYDRTEVIFGAPQQQATQEYVFQGKGWP